MRFLVNLKTCSEDLKNGLSLLSLESEKNINMNWKDVQSETSEEEKM